MLLASAPGRNWKPLNKKHKAFVKGIGMALTNDERAAHAAEIETQRHGLSWSISPQSVSRL